MSDQLRKSQRQEKRVAKKTGGQVSAGSGNGWKRKSDVRSDQAMWEMKRTDAKSISLKLADLERLRFLAHQEGRTPVMHVEIGSRRWVLLEEADYQEVLDDNRAVGEANLSMAQALEEARAERDLMASREVHLPHTPGGGSV